MLMQRDKNILKFIEEYKSITIYQCYRIFFNNLKYGHDHARKRLKILNQMGLLEKAENSVTNEFVYYNDKQLSPHDLYLYDFYSLLIYNGAKVLEFRKEPVYENIRPDAFIKYEFNGDIRGVLVEVDFTHATTISKYDKVMAGYFKRIYGGNPFVCVVTDNPKKQACNFEVVYLDMKLSNFVSEILS